MCPLAEADFKGGVIVNEARSVHKRAESRGGGRSTWYLLELLIPVTASSVKGARALTPIPRRLAEPGDEVNPWLCHQHNVASLAAARDANGSKQGPYEGMRSS